MAEQVDLRGQHLAVQPETDDGGLSRRSHGRHRLREVPGEADGPVLRGHPPPSPLLLVQPEQLADRLAGPRGRDDVDVDARGVDLAQLAPQCGRRPGRHPGEQLRQLTDGQLQRGGRRQSDCPPRPVRRPVQACGVRSQLRQVDQLPARFGDEGHPQRRGCLATRGGHEDVREVGDLTAERRQHRPWAAPLQLERGGGDQASGRTDDEHAQPAWSAVGARPGRRPCVGLERRRRRTLRIERVPAVGQRVEPCLIADDVGLETRCSTAALPTSCVAPAEHGKTQVRLTPDAAGQVCSHLVVLDHVVTVATVACRRQAQLATCGADCPELGGFGSLGEFTIRGHRRRHRIHRR